MTAAADAPALVRYVESRASQVDVVHVSSARNGVSTVTRRDTGAVIGTVAKSSDGSHWTPTTPDGVEVDSCTQRQTAVGKLIDRAVLLDVDEDEAIAARDEREAHVVDEPARENLTRWADEVEARGIAEAIAARAAAADEARRELDYASAYGRAFASDPFVLGLVERGDHIAAPQAANSVASILADRYARDRTSYRQAIRRELVNVEGDLDEHADAATARDVLDLLDAAHHLVTVGDRPVVGPEEARRLVAYKASEAERADLDLVFDHLRHTPGIDTRSDVLRFLVTQHAALIRAAQDAPSV